MFNLLIVNELMHTGVTTVKSHHYNS